MFKHTQGEWVTQNYNQIVCNGELICTTNPDHNGKGTNKIDNRPLIETAPKMLEALVDIQKDLRFHGMNNSLVDAAISAAKG